ncbi:MAG: hypothetical protein IPG23_24980 [Burkholderiales bacterium]|nr:hypothetical protein [Burkholderiales bacterium]
MEQLLDVLEGHPEERARFQQFWQQLVAVLDGSTLLADYGFASRNAMLSEFVQRLHLKLLPTSPETLDASELFALAMPDALDAQGSRLCQKRACKRIALLLWAPATPPPRQQHPPSELLAMHTPGRP